ncbi:MAG: acyl-CoA dehydrogenase family protein [Pseudomonadota bacterium]
MSTIVNRRDVDFMLYETFDLERHLENERYGEYDRESITAIFDLAQSIAEDIYQPCAAHIDANEPKYVDGKAITDPVTKPALEAFNEAGLSTCGYETESRQK